MNDKILLESENFKDKIIYHNNSNEINFEAALLSHNVIEKLIYNHREELYDSLRSSFHIRKIIYVIYLGKHINFHDIKYKIFSQLETKSLMDLIDCFERLK